MQFGFRIAITEGNWILWDDESKGTEAQKTSGPFQIQGKGTNMQAKSTAIENLELSSMRGTQQKMQQMFSASDIVGEAADHTATYAARTEERLR